LKLDLKFLGKVVLIINFELGFMSFVCLIIVGKSNTHVMLLAEIVETEFGT